jgi:co-chaperonin GroES (HSP10)
MKPIGKTYLIKADIKKGPELVNGLYIPPDNDYINDVYYQGFVIAHGTGFSEDEEKTLVPCGTKVIFEYMEKRGTKLVFGNNVYYIKYEDQVLGIVENE